MEQHAWTPRQREVLDCLAEGLTNAQVAERLGISLDGAKWHVREVMGILGVESRDEAAEYWRARSGLPFRLRRFARGFPAMLVRRWQPALVAVLVAVAAAVVAAFALGDDDEAAPGKPTAALSTWTITVGPGTPQPSTIASTPTIAPANRPPITTYEGKPVYELVYEPDPVALPDDTAIYFATSCGACLGWDLARLHRDGSGQWRERALSTGAAAVVGPGFPIGQYFTDGRGTFAVLWCKQGARTCGKQHDGTVDDVPRAIVRSTDGGVSWEVLGEAPPPVFITRVDGQRVTVATSFGDTGPARYREYPGGQEVMGPPMPIEVRPTIADFEIQHMNGLANEFSTLVGFGAAYYALPGGALTPGAKLSLSAFVAGAERSDKTALAGPQARALPGIPRLPVVVDLAARTIRPLVRPLPPNPFDHVSVLHALAGGPWLTVKDSSENCLNVREAPALTAGVLACYTDEVLLGDRGESRTADGVTWRAVRLPDGRDGWASVEFLAAE